MRTRHGIPRSAFIITCVLIVIIVLSSAIGAFLVLQASKSIPARGSVKYGSTSLPFEDGFESGDFSSWTSTAISSGETVSTTNVMTHHGNYGAKFTTNGDTIYEAAYSYITMPSPANELYVRGYVRVSQSGITNDDDRFYFIVLRAGTNGVSYAGWRQVGGIVKWDLVIRDGTGWVTASYGSGITFDAWHSVEVHWFASATQGYGELYVDGALAIRIEGKDTASFGSVDEVRFGLAELYSSGSTKVSGDCFVVSQSYIGQELTSIPWAVIGPREKIPAMANIFWLFGNQSIPYIHLHPNEVASYETIKNYAGLVTWTRLNELYNFTAVRLFAETKPVVSDVFDFSYYLYPKLKGSLQTVYVSTVIYEMDWGNFQKNDRPEMHNGTRYLKGVLASDLSSFANITTIAKISTTMVALFQMRGTNPHSGFYVTDLSVTRPNSYESGNYHIFPAIAKSSLIRAGRYSRWMTDGLSWRSLNWINSWMINFTNANGDIAKMQSIGTSVQGRVINALFIGKGTKNFIADGAIHGGEKSGSFGIIRFAELLVEWYRVSSSWQLKLNEYKVILIPVLNPDGYVANTRANANGKDLNRQFPPGATTTEPEAWALRWLMGNYTPTQYVTLHADDSSYPLHVFYAGGSTEPYRTFAKSVINEGDLRFQDLGHWGTVYDGDWVGRYIWSGPTGGLSMSDEYAYYKHKALSFLVEHFSHFNPGANLHAQDFYITTLLAPLIHHERADGFMTHSNTFTLSESYNNATFLSILVDATSIAGERTSETKIYDFNARGKPKAVHIDGLQSAEGINWTWRSTSNTTTVIAARETIVMQW